MSTISPPIIEEIVDQHFEEAAFLWSLRDDAATASNYTLSDLAFLDERVEAHVDGLRIAGDYGWELCEAGLDPEDPGTVFVATIIAFESDDKKRIDLLVTASNQSRAAFRAVVSGLGWMDVKKFNALIIGMVSSKSRRYRRLGIASCGIRRINPRAYLDQAVDSSDLFLKSLAFKTAGEIKRTDLLPKLQKHFQHEDHDCRFEAVRAAFLLGDHTAMDTLGSFVVSKSKYTLSAMQIALRLANAQIARNWLKTMSRDPALRRLMLVAVGFSGDPTYIPMLLKQMEAPEYARVAGESFSAITGVDLDLSKLSAEWPEGYEAGPNDDAEDDDVEMDMDEDLPWPDASLVAQWWDQNSSSLPVGARHLAGSPVSMESCAQILKTGNQRQRQAAALEIALSSPEASYVNTKKPGFRLVNAP